MKRPAAALINHPNPFLCSLRFARRSSPQPENDVFGAMSPDDHKHARKVILAAILGTDMSRHMEHVTALHERAERRNTTPFERNR